MFKLSSKNEGNNILIKGMETPKTIEKVLADGQHFRIKAGEGSPVTDYTLGDVEAGQEMIIEIA